MMNRAADYRTVEDKLFDMWNHPSASEGEKFNAGAAYFKRTGKLIQMHQRTPDPNVRPSVSASTIDEIMREWERQQAARRAAAASRPAADPYAYGRSDYNDPDRVAARDAARRVASAARARARAASGARRSTTYRSRWESSSSAKDYSSRGWSRHAGGWIDEDGRYHDAQGRYAKRPR